MKKIVWLAALVLILTGCNANAAWETVADTIEPDCPVWTEHTYEIQHGIPAGMQLAYEAHGEKLYTDGCSELSVRKFLADDVETAVKILSGYEAERLQLIRTERFGLPQYHFVWCAMSEEGEWLSRAAMIMDGTACYAMVSTVSGDEGSSPDVDCLSTFGLYMDEGV